MKLLAAPCTPADLRTTAARPPPPPSPNHHASGSALEFPRTIGGTEALWEITAVGGDVSSLRPGDLAVPVVAGNDPGNGARQAAGTWRTTATLTEASLVKVPIGGSGAAAAGVLEEKGGDGGGVGFEVAAHCSGSVATAIRILEDFAEKELGAGDRVVFTGASSAVAQARCWSLLCLLFSEIVGLQTDRCIRLTGEAQLSSRMVLERYQVWRLVGGVFFMQQTQGIKHETHVAYGRRARFYRVTAASPSPTGVHDANNSTPAHVTALRVLCGSATSDVGVADSAAAYARHKRTGSVFFFWSSPLR